MHMSVLPRGTTNKIYDHEQNTIKRNSVQVQAIIEHYLKDLTLIHFSK